MKKIRFTDHILPHIAAILVFLIVTMFFFSPVFFNNKTLEQYDIQMFKGTARVIQEHRAETGEEALWASNVFSGMPAYLISVSWSNGPVTFIKAIMSMGIPHPISNIFLSFLCYYIMLLAFGIRPYLAIGGAIAFGISSYMIIGFSAGHNGRIGAIAFMPLVMAGIHLCFTNRKALGFGVTTAGLALHLRDNHLQMTYYLLLIVIGYGIIAIIRAARNKTLPDFFKTIALLIVAALIGAGTFFGQFWAITEYSAYSIRGKSDLAGATPQQQTEDALGISKTYAFDYSNGILEPLTLLIPNFYGGSTSSLIIEDPKSETTKVLQNAINQGNEKLVNQLYPYSSSYWGPQFNTAPYYAGAIIVFLFAVGIAFAERKYVLWLAPLCALSVILSWGSNFTAFNYFIFDYLPGYNKFRSVTFTLIIILFSMPLLGMLGLEKLMRLDFDKQVKKKLLIAFASTGGLCLLILLFAGMFGFTKEVEAQLPDWFVNALAQDRKGLLRGDAFRSLAFIVPVFILIYFQIYKKIAPIVFYAVVIFLITVDLAVVDKRYFGEESFKRKRDNTFFALTEADQFILNDNSNFRVYALNPQSAFGAFSEAKTSYHHNSIGGYHGAKLRRYQEFVDSCFSRQIESFIGLAQQGNFDFKDLGAFNMLNIKYIPYGPQRGNVIPNQSANGNAWFVREIVKVNSAAGELERTCTINTKTTAVIDASAFQIPDVQGDTASAITLVESRPNYLKYESNSTGNGLAVFSEIYYPKGWIATIDGKETQILRANYILRALEIPSGKHTVEFSFRPKAYYVGNKVTMISSWLMILAVVGTIAFSIRQELRTTN
jgi:hypothetical protein